MNRNLELARAEKALGASLEAKMLLHCADPAVSDALARWSGASNGVDELSYVLLASSVEVLGSAGEVEAAGSLASLTDAAAQATIGIARADGTKCDRCWYYYMQVSTDGPYPGTCARCGEALAGMEFPAVAPKESFFEPEAAAA